MDVRKEDFPVVLQAFDMLDNKEVFIAELVVNNQAEVDAFTTRYSGKLIKAKQWTDTKNTRQNYTTHQKKTSSPGLIWLIILIILIALIVIGFATGWIQRTFNIDF